MPSQNRLKHYSTNITQVVRPDSISRNKNSNNSLLTLPTMIPRSLPVTLTHTRLCSQSQILIPSLTLTLILTQITEIRTLLVIKLALLTWTTDCRVHQPHRLTLTLIRIIMARYSSTLPPLPRTETKTGTETESVLTLISPLLSNCRHSHWLATTTT